MRGKRYICDDCGCVDTFSSYIKARAASWAVAKDYSNCYCPSCAPKHRHGKASKKNNQPELSKGFEQLSIGAVSNE